MSVVRDLSNLPVGTKIEKIANGEVVITLCTTSLYENFKYFLKDENGHEYSLTIKELMWDGYRIYFPEEELENSLNRKEPLDAVTCDKCKRLFKQ